MRCVASRLAAAAVALAALAMLTACSSSGEEVREHIADSYQLVSEDGSLAQYQSNESVDQVGAAISSVAEPGREHQDNTGLYLGYEDAMVHIQRAATGSEIEVTDPQDGYNRWGPAIVPIWGTYGGSYSQGFSGGGPGFGK